MTQAFTSPITSRLKGGLFNPLEFNPYLLFDAETSMSGTLESPTLDLDPSDESTLDVITATRAGVATYTDLHGNIKQAASDTVRVDYTQGEELTPTKFQNIGYTDFSQWTSSNSTFNSGQITSPDGTLNGSSLQINSGGYFYVTIASSHGVGDSFTFSCFVKSPLQKLTWGGATANGTDVYSYEDVGNGWYRQILTRTFSATGSLQPMFTEAQAGSDLFYIYGPQLEEGTTATDFVANTTGSPKFITGATYADRVPMILVEPSATNIIYNSSEFSTSGTAVKTTGFEAPDGTNTATKISNMQDATGIRAYSQVTSVSGSTAYVGSIYIKGTAGETVRIEGRRQAGATFSSSGTQELTFDGTWQRVTNLAWTTAADNTAVFILIKNESGTTADEVYLWGSQFEEGTVSTSVIPTSGSPVTRAADDLVISGSDFTDFYNSSEGTVYTEAIGRGYFNGNTVFAFNSGNSSNDSIYQRSPSNNQVLVVIDSTNGGLQAQLGSSGSVVSTGTLVRRAASFKLNNFKGSQDGVDTLPDTSGTIPTIDRLRVGASPTGLNHLNGHIKRLIYWPYHSDRL